MSYPLFFISFSMGSCLVIFQCVLLGALSVHIRCRILHRHLLVNVVNVGVSLSDNDKTTIVYPVCSEYMYIIHS